MTYVYSKIDMDFTDYEDLKRDADAPTVKMILALEGVLSESFAMTQNVVHIITGNLKASGRASSELHGNVWTSTITYGGGEVDYAWYENRRGGVRADVGTPHEFMLPAWDTMGEAMKAAVEATWMER